MRKRLRDILAIRNAVQRNSFEFSMEFIGAGSPHPLTHEAGEPRPCKRKDWLFIRGGNFRMGFSGIVLIILITISSCQKEVNINIPPGSQQVVVDGSIENGVPPIILLTKSQGFFTSVDLNNLGSYFIHGAQMKVTGSDGTQTQLSEFCLADLNLPAAQTQLLLTSLGYNSIDSASAVNVCAYTVPDIINYYLTGTSSFMGKVQTTYNLTITSPPLNPGQDSVHLTASTSIPVAIGIDSLQIQPDPDPVYADSFASVLVYLSVPDTFGNFVRFKTRENSQPFYSPLDGDVYDDRLFVGLHISLPLQRGEAPSDTFNLNTINYFIRGDTLTVKWSNIDSKTYNFFYTLENDGGSSPFSSPVKIVGNVNNGLGVFAGYATKYYTIYVPK